MLHRTLLPSLAFSALFLPCSFGAPAGDGPAELVQRFLADVDSGATYDCNGQCSKEGCTDQCPWASSPRVQLGSLIAEGPEAVAVLQPLFVDAVAAKSTTEAQRAELIGVLLTSRNAAVVPVAEAMFAKKPEAFCCTGLTGFCEMGSEALVEPLEKRLAKGEAGVAAAAFLASRGVTKAKGQLARAVKTKDVTVDNALDLLVAADALERHFGAEGARDAARERVHAATLAALDAGELEAARALALAAQVAHEAAHARRPYYSLLALRHGNLVASTAKEGELACPDAIFELIESVTPIG